MHLLTHTLQLSARKALYNKIGFLNAIDIVNLDARVERFDLGELLILISICKHSRCAFNLIRYNFIQYDMY